MRAQRKCLLTALSAEIRTWLSRSWFYFCNNRLTGWHKCTRPIKEWGMVNQLNAISDYFNQLVGNSSVHNKLKSKAREKLWRHCDWLNEAAGQRDSNSIYTRVLTNGVIIYTAISMTRGHDREWKNDKYIQTRANIVFPTSSTIGYTHQISITSPT